MLDKKQKKKLTSNIDDISSYERFIVIGAGLRGIDKDNSKTELNMAISIEGLTASNVAKILAQAINNSIKESEIVEFSALLSVEILKILSSKQSI